MIQEAVISQLHVNSGILSSVMPGARMFMIVTMTLIAPMMDEAPIKWIAKIDIGNALPVWRESGGYIVQPLAGAPPSTKSVASSREKAKGRIQRLRLFMRARGSSGVPVCSGIMQFTEPTNAGTTTPKIVTSTGIVVMK